MNVLQM